MTVGHVRNDRTSLQSLGDDGNPGLAGQSPSALDAAEQLDPARPDRIRSVTNNVIIDSPVMRYANG
jgi:hypothetical protein